MPTWTDSSAIKAHPMTWPERLDLLLAILAQVPWSWVMTGLIAGVVLGIIIVILAAIVTVSGDVRHRDVYYENHVEDNHT